MNISLYRKTAYKAWVLMLRKEYVTVYGTTWSSYSLSNIHMTLINMPGMSAKESHTILQELNEWLWM